MYRMSVGYMVWSNKSGRLYCEEVDRGKASPQPIEELIHVACFEDGPARHDEDLISSPVDVLHVEYPHCTLCNHSLDSGDQVYAFQKGYLHQMEFHLEALFVLKKNVYEVRSVYAHTYCVAKNTEEFLPTPPEENAQNIEYGWDY